jgi:hypothetical protein
MLPDFLQYFLIRDEAGTNATTLIWGTGPPIGRMFSSKAGDFFTRSYEIGATGEIATKSAGETGPVLGMP